MKKSSCLVIAMLGATAHADSIKAPAGWTPDPGASVSLTKKTGDMPHFGGLRAIVTTEVYRPPAGGSLFVTRLSANVKAEDKDRAATAELVELDASMRRAGATVQPGQNAVDAAAKQLVASRQWSTSGIATHARIVIAADAQVIVAVMGECVLAGDAPPDVVNACRTALTTLDPGIAAASRVPLAIDAATLDAAGKPAPVPATGSGASGPSLVESGERPSLPPMTIPQETREPDRRPIYVGLGLIVLAVVFYWNRKNREKLEREYEKRTPDKPEKPPEPKTGDRDADDLHAAAEDGDRKEKS